MFPGQYLCDLQVANDSPTVPNPKVENLPGEHARFDQCQFGLVSKVDRNPIQKTTVLCSNMPAIISAFHGRTCAGGHTHCSIQGSEGGLKRSTWAQYYPTPMCEALAKAILDQWQQDSAGK